MCRELWEPRVPSALVSKEQAVESVYNAIAVLSSFLEPHSSEMAPLLRFGLETERRTLKNQTMTTSPPLSKTWSHTSDMVGSGLWRKAEALTKKLKYFSPHFNSECSCGTENALRTVWDELWNLTQHWAVKTKSGEKILITATSACG